MLLEVTDTVRYIWKCSFSNKSKTGPLQTKIAFIHGQYEYIGLSGIKRDHYERTEPLRKTKAIIDNPRYIGVSFFQYISGEK